MKKVVVVTDSNSGITQEEANILGVRVIPMPFYINDELFYEGITLTQEEFYKKLEEDAEITTSQPAPGDVMELWDELLKEYDEIVHIPMSSGLSSTCATATMLADDYDGRVFVVDNQRISVTLRQSVIDALHLVNAGKGGQEIKEILEDEKLLASIYITLDTLHYLKKGGRITPAAAAIGTVLNLKPVLQIQGEKLDSFAKVRGKKAAKKAMIQAIKKDLEERFAEYEGQGLMGISAAYSGAADESEEWLEELKKQFPEREIIMRPLSLSVSCHIGPGALAVTCEKKVEA